MVIRFTVRSILGICFMASSIAFPAGVRAETKPLLEPPPDYKASPAFRAILKAKPGSEIFEIRKIEYLLERLRRSKCLFIRNREEHKGEMAVLHMQWKYARYKDEIKTAEDFARKIADGSRKTREDYHIKRADGRIYSSTEILLNELAELDEALGKEIS